MRPKPAKLCQQNDGNDRQTRSPTAPAAPAATAELPRRDGRTDRRHRRGYGCGEGQAEIGPGPTARTSLMRLSGKGAWAGLGRVSEAARADAAAVRSGAPTQVLGAASSQSHNQRAGIVSRRRRDRLAPIADGLLHCGEWSERLVALVIENDGNFRISVAAKAAMHRVPSSAGALSSGDIPRASCGSLHR
jgi:hypothetical protein